jgi:hypothetical protein
MKSLRRLCAVAALTCVFAVSSYAGDMSAGIVNDTSPPPAQPAMTTGEATQPELETNESDKTGDGVVEFMLTLLQSVLSGL